MAGCAYRQPCSAASGEPADLCCALCGPDGASGVRSTSEDVVTVLPGLLAELDSGTPAPGAERADPSTGLRAGPIGSTSYSSDSMAYILLAPPHTRPGVIGSIPSARSGSASGRPATARLLLPARLSGPMRVATHIRAIKTHTMCKHGPPPADPVSRPARRPEPTRNTAYTRKPRESVTPGRVLPWRLGRRHGGRRSTTGTSAGAVACRSCLLSPNI